MNHLMRIYECLLIYYYVCKYVYVCVRVFELCDSSVEQRQTGSLKR